MRAGTCCGGRSAQACAQILAERPGAAVAGMADVGGARDALCEPADRDHPAATCEPNEEKDARVDLGPGRPAVRGRRARMGRDDVPAEDVGPAPELVEGGTDDGRGRLGRAGPRQLALGGERDAADARSPVARRLAYEQDRRPRVSVAAVLEPALQHGSALAVSSEVERG